MKLHYLFLSLLLIAVTTLSACSDDDTSTVSNQLPLPGDYSLPLIETTDIHGHIVSIEADDTHYKLAYIADKVKDIRGRGADYKKERLLLLDGGDLYQGTTCSNLQMGKPIYMAIDKMDYDAVALGNHEFDWGLENMLDSDGTLLGYEHDGQSYTNEVPVLCANIYQNNARISQTRDYVILEKTAVNELGSEVKVKIAIIGFAEDYSSSIMTSQFSGKGYSIKTDFTIANDIAQELESTGQADAYILLIHSAADVAANKLSEGTAIDLVLGGHSHVNISGQTSWGLPYLQAESYSEAYAYTELNFHVDEKGTVSFTNVKDGETIAVDNSRDTRTHDGENADDLDDDILSLSDEAIMSVSEQLNKVIGYINVDATDNYPDTNLSLPGSGGRASVMGNWMSDIYMRIGEADVAFMNSGGVRTSFPLNGNTTRNITYADVYDIFPFNNHIYVYQITYAELLQLFEYSMTSSGKGLLSRVTGIDCYYTSTEGISASGKTYTETAVHSLVKDGTTIYEAGIWQGDWASRTVTVATNEYVATTDRVYTYSNPAMHNPFTLWNDTPRLIMSELIDSENAIRILQAEAEASGGLLSIDLKPHFILYTK